MKRQARIAGFLLLPVTLSFLAACATPPPEDTPLVTSGDIVVAQSPGVPGGVVQATEELNATVVSISQTKRTFVVKDAQGNQRTVQAPPEMVNFDQLAVGDRIRAAVIVETIVYVQDAGKPVPDNVSSVVGSAGPGEKPAAATIEQARVTAKVIAVNTTKHSATLQFEDGSKLEVAVRPDVKVSQASVGKEVVIIITAALATVVEEI